MTAPAPLGPNVINNHIAKRAPSRHDNTVRNAGTEPADKLRDALGPTHLEGKAGVVAAELRGDVPPQPSLVALPKGLDVVARKLLGYLGAGQDVLH
jgi:hypothetical protein